MSKHKGTRRKKQHERVQPEQQKEKQQITVSQLPAIPQVVYQPSSSDSHLINGVMIELAHTVRASLCLDGENVLTKNYIIEDEFMKLQEQYKQLQMQHYEFQNGAMKATEQQLSDLRRILESKDMEIAQLKNDIEKLNRAIAERSEEDEKLRRENEGFKKEIKELQLCVRELGQSNEALKQKCASFEEQNMKMTQMIEEYDCAKISQKCCEHLNRIYNDLQDVFCTQTSPIYKMTYCGLRKLAEKLQQYHYRTFGKFSEIAENLTKWVNIYENVQNELKTKFNISNIEVFFEIVRIKQHRNYVSHPQEKITRDEINKITQFPEEIWQLIVKYRT